MVKGMVKGTAKGISVSLALVAFFAFASCRNEATVSSSTPATHATSAATLSPEDLGTLGARIQKNPNDADRLLHDRGLTQEQFAAEVRKVAEDPAASKRYAAAYKKTKA